MVDKNALLARASRLRGLQACHVAHESASGYSHRIHAIHFEDGIVLAARVTLDKDTWNLDLRSIATMRRLKQLCPTIKIPSVYATDDGKREDGVPLVLMEWVEGRPLKVWNSSLPLQCSTNFLNDLAQFLLNLWSVTLPADDDLTSSMKYSTWLEGDICRPLRRTLSGNARWGDPIDYLIMRSMIPHYASGIDTVQELRIAHGDTNASNYMVDEDLHLTGVVDWDWAYYAPLAGVVQYPWFLADIPGWHNDGVGDDETFESDRFFLEQAIRRQAPSNTFALQIADLLRTSKERHFFQSAFHIVAVHKEFVSRYCARSPANLIAARNSLKEFLQSDDSLAQLPQVHRIQEYLSSVEESGPQPCNDPTNLAIEDRSFIPSQDK
ncbi:hypothetical protein FH972_024124 [Carpinus fangiana]|uniref:Aminoglycoside phosphotransferase domain-containing protein n=1 Tax=Carpinus fangiana TaxID=176857 RepID=A0A5N6KXJ2_9ROSI|nr:hypothetical protein FH972_024124 [Carpinus fangiana]